MDTFNATWLIHAAIVIGVIGLSQIAALLFRRMALRSGKSILEPLTKISKIQIDGLNKFPMTENSNNEKLQSLFEIVSNRKEHHKKVFLKLYQFHFEGGARESILECHYSF